VAVVPAPAARAAVAPAPVVPAAVPPDPGAGLRNTLR